MRPRWSRPRCCAPDCMSGLREAIRFTFSVRSFQVPETPFTSAWPPSLPSVPTSLATRVTSAAKARSCSTMMLMVQVLAHARAPRRRTSTVIFAAKRGQPLAIGGRRPGGDGAHPIGQVRGQEVHVVGEVLPGAGHARHLGLAAQLALDTHLAGHRHHLLGEGAQRVGHGVDGVGQGRDPATWRQHGRDLLGEVAVRRRRGRDLGVDALRTWLVRLLAIKFTLSVKSFQVPETPFTSAWPPSLPSVPTSLATRVTSAAKARSCSTMVLTVFLSSRISPRASTVIFWERSPLATTPVVDQGDVAHPGWSGCRPRDSRCR